MPFGPGTYPAGDPRNQGTPSLAGGYGGPPSGGAMPQGGSLASLPPWMQGLGRAPQGIAPQLSGLGALPPYLGPGGYSGMGGPPRPQFNPAMMAQRFGGQVPQMPQFAGGLQQALQGFNPVALGARFAGGLGGTATPAQQMPLLGTPSS